MFWGGFVKISVIILDCMNMFQIVVTANVLFVGNTSSRGGDFAQIGTKIKL